MGTVTLLIPANQSEQRRTRSALHGIAEIEGATRRTRSRGQELDLIWMINEPRGKGKEETVDASRPQRNLDETGTNKALSSNIYVR